MPVSPTLTDATRKAVPAALIIRRTYTPDRERAAGCAGAVAGLASSHAAARAADAEPPRPGGGIMSAAICQGSTSTRSPRN